MSVVRVGFYVNGKIFFVGIGNCRDVCVGFYKNEVFVCRSGFIKQCDVFDFWALSAIFPAMVGISSGFSASVMIVGFLSNTV